MNRIARILIAVAFIVVGVLAVGSVLMFNWDSPQLRSSPPQVPWFIGGGMIGGGIGSFSRRPGVGAIIGLIVQVMTFLIVATNH